VDGIVGFHDAIRKCELRLRIDLHTCKFEKKSTNENISKNLYHNN